MSKYTISIKQLSRDYGYDESTIRKNWVKAGLNLSAPENEIREWIVKNILNPLCETDIREQIDRARLEKMQSEAELAKFKAFTRQTGLELMPGCGIDTGVYRDLWHGASPVCEVVTVEY